MLCVSVWSGRDLSKASQTFSIPCYAKLSGKYVGNIMLCTSTSAYQVLKCIQVQASKMVPHAWRGFEDIMAWCDNQWLIPSGFAYRDQLTQEEEEQAWSALRNAKRVELMWDDNDEHALKVLQKAEIQVAFCADGVIVWLRRDWQDSLYVLPVEVTCIKQRRRRIVVVAQTKRLQLVDLQALERLGAEQLELHNIEPTSWNACCTVKSLVYSGSQTRVPKGVATLRRLEDLFLVSIASLPEDFGKLALKTLKLSRCELDLACLATQCASMPTLKDLCVEEHRKANLVIPTELGLLASLERLVLTRNNFVGGIPSELGNLAKLSHFCVHEFKNSVLDMTLPKVVLDLHIQSMTVDRGDDWCWK